MLFHTDSAPAVGYHQTMNPTDVQMTQGLDVLAINPFTPSLLHDGMDYD